MTFMDVSLNTGRIGTKLTTLARAVNRVQSIHDARVSVNLKTAALAQV